VLAPIAGACAFFSLVLPFYISGVSTFVVLVMCWLSFKEATELVQPRATRTRTTSLERLSAVQTPKKVVVEGSPCKDPIVWMHCFASGCIVLMMSGVNLLLPTLLAEEGFGLHGDTVKETQQHVSIAVGLLNVPSSILSFFATCLLFIPLTKKFGDVAVTAVFGFAMSVAFCSFALLNHSLWMVAFVFSVTGFCRGLVFPVAGPLFATYYKQVFPTQQATAQSAGSIGVCISQLISQVLVARIFTVFGKYGAWCFLGGMGAVFSVTLMVTVCLVARRAKPQLHAGQEALLGIIERGQPVDAYMDDSRRALLSVLQQRKEHLWNGAAQVVFTSWMESAPSFPVATVADCKVDNEQYLQEMHQLMLKHCPQETAEEFQKRILVQTVEQFTDTPNTNLFG